MEIAEEDEEEQRAVKRQSVVPEGEGERPETPVNKTSIPDPVTLNSDLASSPEQSKFSSATTSDVPKFVGAGDGPTSPARSIDADGRPDLFSYSSYSSYGKPKVKLGPRPSLDVNNRPQTAGNFRPVSSIPAGFKLFGKGGKKGKGKDANSATSPQEEVPEMNFPQVSTAAAEEPLPSSNDLRPATSTGVPAISTTLAAPVSKKVPMTPEKTRLMKAMQLRQKKKMQASAAALMPDTEMTTIEDDTTTTADDGDAASEKVEAKAHEQVDINDELDDHHQLDGADKKHFSPITHADSGVVLDMLSSPVHTDHTDHTSDSRPESPAAVSEPDQSTGASSLSESTDETIQGKDLDVPRREENDEGNPMSANDSDTKQAEETLHESHQDDSNLATGGESNAGENMLSPQLIEHDEVLLLSPDVYTPNNGGASPSLGPDVEVDIKSPAETGANEQEIRDTVTLPISEFSANNSLLPTAQQDALEMTSDSAVTDGEEEATSPKLRVPRSKFSTQDLSGAAKAAAAAETPIATPVVELDSNPVVLEDPVTPAKDEVRVELVEAQHEEQVQPQTKRTPAIARIQTDVASHGCGLSEGQISEDEDLMEELHSATLQDAHPLIVTKSPLTPLFSSPISAIRPSSAAGSTSSHTVRTVSNPVRGGLIVPTDVTQSSARSLSSGAAYLHKVTQQQTASGNLGMKSNVGSSISQRIKALEMLSAGSGEPPRPVSRDRPSSTFFSVQKKDPARAPSVMDRGKTFRKDTPPSPSPPIESSPEAASKSGRRRSGSVVSRLSVFETSPRPNSSHSHAHQSRNNQESVSVTAKIIRDPNQAQNLEPPRDPSEYHYLDLKQSPLVVDHQKAMPHRSTTVAVESAQERRSISLEREKDDKTRRSSLSIVKDFIKERRKSVTSVGDVFTAPTVRPSRSPSRPSSTHQNNTAFTNRLSMTGRRASMSKDRDNNTQSTATDGPTSGDDNRSSSSDKKKSRAGRFMRRLSNLSGSRSKTSTSPMLSPTVAEEGDQAIKMSQSNGPGSPWIVSYLGDVNVQFPDNLLWKRRNVCLDSQGFLILSALAALNGRPAQGTKRYHLSEFRSPYTPDVEIQELPNSVVLDFIEGTGIQLACEDRAGQLNVLHGKHSQSLPLSRNIQGKIF